MFHLMKKLAYIEIIFLDKGVIIFKIDKSAMFHKLYVIVRRHTQKNQTRMQNYTPKVYGIKNNLVISNHKDLVINSMVTYLL